LADRDEAPDRSVGAPHPREQTLLFGHAEAERVFLDAFRAGQLHHAWLVGGVEGIGKATFAYRAARFLLAHPDPTAAAVDAATSLFVDAGHPAARQLAVQSHPDVAIVRRGLKKDGKGYLSEIAVADIRRMLDLFETTSGAGGYRICIVDSADDLNASSANALLKMIEEPPPRSLFLIVAHAPARALATIRSRCRRLALRPLSPADVGAAIRSLGPPWSENAEPLLEQAANLSQGSVAKALSLLDADVIALIEAVQGVLDRLPHVQPGALLALAEALAGRANEDDFETAFGVIEGWIAAEVRSRAGEGAARLAPLVEVWEKNARATREAQVFNLDRRPLVISMFGDLAEAVRRSRAA